jgi:hypothetical protein
MATGKKAGSEAGKVLADPSSTKAEKGAAASDLAQVPHKAPAKKTPAKAPVKPAAKSSPAKAPAKAPTKPAAKGARGKGR